MTKYPICRECLWNSGRLDYVCDACDEGDQFEPTDESIEDDDEPGDDEDMSLGAGKKVIRILEAA